MKTYKIIQKPSGILGLTFEDLKYLALFIMIGFMMLNFFNYVMKVHKLAYLGMLLSSVMAVVFLKKANRKGRYYFVQSLMAWPFTPKRVFIGKVITIFDVQISQKNKNVRR